MALQTWTTWDLSSIQWIFGDSGKLPLPGGENFMFLEGWKDVFQLKGELFFRLGGVVRGLRQATLFWNERRIISVGWEILFIEWGNTLDLAWIYCLLSRLLIEGFFFSQWYTTSLNQDWAVHCNHYSFFHSHGNGKQAPKKKSLYSLQKVVLHFHDYGRYTA